MISSLQGSTALHLSSNNGHKEVVTILLDHAADPNIKNTDVSIKLCPGKFLKKNISYP